MQEIQRTGRNKDTIAGGVHTRSHVHQTQGKSSDFIGKLGPDLPAGFGGSPQEAGKMLKATMGNQEVI